MQRYPLSAEVSNTGPAPRIVAVTSSQRNSITSSLADHTAFLRSWLSAPLRTGAIAPSSEALARAMAFACAPQRGTRIVELGPGTGVVTRALIEAGVCENDLTLVELAPAFRAILKKQFPRAEILAEDAFSVVEKLSERTENNVSAVVSSLPLYVYSKSKREALRKNALDLVGPHGRFVQFTYNLASPVSSHSALLSTRSRRIWGNFPPAVVWTYQSRQPAIQTDEDETAAIRADIRPPGPASLQEHG